MSVVPALRALATRCATAPSARAALATWHEDAERDLKPVLLAVSRRIRLGASIEDALEPFRHHAPDEAAALVSALEGGARQGASLARRITKVASLSERRTEMTDKARGAAAAARTSGRMLALLAIVFALLLPSWRGAPPAVLAGCIALAAGLTWGGVRWTRSLSPRPPVDDDVAAFADALAGALEAGLGVEAALAAVELTGTALQEDLTTVLRRRRLGAAWCDAFATAEGGLRRIGQLIWCASRSGAPLSADLTALASMVRYETRRDFEINAKKAPVKLVLPLALCFLPAFALVVLGPLLAGLAG